MLPRWLSGKGDGFDPWSGRSPGKGNGNPFQHSYLGNPMNGGDWQASVHEVTRSGTRLRG